MDYKIQQTSTNLALTSAPSRQKQAPDKEAKCQERSDIMHARLEDAIKRVPASPRADDKVSEPRVRGIDEHSRRGPEPLIRRIKLDENRSPATMLDRLAALADSPTRRERCPGIRAV